MISTNVYSAVRWSALAKYAVQGTELVSSVIVARLVMPEAYGLLGMALVAVGLLSVLQNLGFGPAVIRRNRITQGFLSTLFVANIGFSILSLGLLACLAPILAWLYGDPRVSPVTLCLSLVFLLSSFSMIPAALLTRRMCFSRIAIVEIGATLVRCAVAIALAYVGWEVWALVSSSIVGAGIYTVGIWIGARWRPRAWFRWSYIGEVFGFAATLTGTRVLNYGARSMADFLIGARLGAHSLGIYSVASRFMSLPREAIADVVMQVFYPVFSRIQDDDIALGRILVRLWSSIALVAFPCVTGLIAIAPVLIEGILGPKWITAIPVMYAIAPIGAIYAILVPTSHIYLVKGRTDIMFAWEIVRTIIVVASVLVGVPWGITGVAIAIASANVLLAVPNLYIPIRLVNGLSVLTLLRAIFPYGVCAGFMGFGVILLRIALEETTIGIAGLIAILVGSGIAVYSILVYTFRLPAIASVRKLVLVETRATYETTLQH